jgi:hypothetical protein
MDGAFLTNSDRGTGFFFFFSVILFSLCHFASYKNLLTAAVSHISKKNLIKDGIKNIIINCLKNSDVDGSVILKWFFEKWDRGMGCIDQAQDRDR